MRVVVSIVAPSIEGILQREISPFRFSCSEIKVKNQSWTIAPSLPPGLSLDAQKQQITGMLTSKYKSEHTLSVKGEGKTFDIRFKIRIIKPLPGSLSNFVKNLATDGSSIGHGICEFIDNSIDAGATKVKIGMGSEVLSNDPDKLQRPFVIVQDNGKGVLKEGKVTVDALQDALGIATSPDSEYDESRLGAYGVGLPAAALTSARFCTIFTKRDGDSAIGHLSYDDIDAGNDLRFFEIDDIPGYLKDSISFNHSLKYLEKMEIGTIILLQDHYQLRRSIVEPGTEVKFQEFKSSLNLIKSRLKDYLSLIYHKFLETEGVELRRHDGSIIKRKLTIDLGGKLYPLDPLMLHASSHKIGKLGTHIKSLEKAICTIEEKERFYSIKMAVLPGTKQYGGYGRLTKDGRDFDKAIGNALLVYHSNEGSDKPPQPRESQGLYLYRNFRLIEFANWKGLFANAPGTQVARVEILTPLGLPIHDPKLNIQNDFSVDQRKRKMTLSGKIGKEIKEVTQKNRLWHVDDTKKHPLVTRADKRSAYDNLGKKKKAPKGIEAKKAIFEPSEILNQFAPMTLKLKDLTQDLGKSPTRQWKLDAEQVGTGKECTISVDEPGEHKIVLTITSGKKKWQRSLKFNLLEKPKSKKKSKVPSGNDWKVVLNPLGPADPPIILDGDTYEINTNSKALNDIITMIRVLNDE